MLIWRYFTQDQSLIMTLKDAESLKLFLPRDSGGGITVTMNLSLPKQIWLFLTVIGVAVILLWSILAGASKGKAVAQSQVVASNALALASGLKYFFLDQDRYPTALEFGDKNLMLNYFYLFPPADFTSKNCSQSFIYKRPSADNYSLSFCLSEQTNGYAAGWNTISN